MVELHDLRGLVLVFMVILALEDRRVKIKLGGVEVSVVTVLLLLHRVLHVSLGVPEQQLLGFLHLLEMVVIFLVVELVVEPVLLLLGAPVAVEIAATLHGLIMLQLLIAVEVVVEHLMVVIRQVVVRDRLELLLLATPSN